MAAGFGVSRLGGGSIGDGKSMDFFGPSFQVVIIPSDALTKDTVTISADALDAAAAGKSVFNSLANRFAQYVTSISITQVLGGSTSCSVVFSPPYELAIDIMNKTEVIQHQNILLVKLGYPETNDATKTFVFRTENPSIQFGRPTIQITIAGTPLTTEMSRNVAAYSWSMATLPQSALGIIKSIAEDYGLNVVTEDKDGIVSSNLAKFPSGLTSSNIWPDTIDQAEDDYTLIRRLCKAGNASFRIDGTDLVIMDHQKVLLDEAVCLFRFYGQVDIAERIWPMESFSIDSSTLGFLGINTNSRVNKGISNDKEVPDKAREFSTVTEADFHAALGEFAPKMTAPEAKSSNAVQATLDGSEGGLQAKVDPGSVAGSQQETTSTVIPAPLQSVARRHIGKEHYQAGDTKYPNKPEAESADSATGIVQADLVTPGNPYVFPLQLIAVDGVGRFNGTYQVYEVSHQYDQGAWKTTLKVRSSSFGSNSLSGSKFFQVLADNETGGKDTRYKVPTNQGLIAGSSLTEVPVTPTDITGL